MSMRRVSGKVQAIDQWRRRPVYRARILNAESSAIVLESARTLKVGQRISFVMLSEFEEATPQEWRSAVIWRIENDCLHLTRT